MSVITRLVCGVDFAEISVDMGGISMGVVCLVAVMLLWNYLITPIYQNVPRDVVVKMLPTVFLKQQYSHCF